MSSFGVATVIVCGGRDFEDWTFLSWVLDRVLSHMLSVGYDDLAVVTGTARGADELAETWARDRELNYRGYPARWRRLGKSAGYERNKRMLETELWTPLTLVVAFPGGKGTANTIKLAEERGVPTLLVPAQEVDEFLWTYFPGKSD